MEGYDFLTHDGRTLFNTVFMKAEEAVPVHDHDYPHECFVVQGTVRFSIGGIVKELSAPSTVHFPNGAIHGWEAVTDALVICTHPADKIP